ncbi:hypothetical protein Cgig2_029191 [Carnegiea gigantea]|uniref:Uncharacterized protein n=1 Tax=Carnegiea gigantea TaxID=171969 RepID=A0A9Q1KKN7_9CARY|nr:hypothetical protein Cgig2_029191 [Carnegiea gigantea]
MEEKSHQEPKSVALIVGVTGMAGLSIAETLKSPSALGGPWKVYGSARRPKPDWLLPPLLTNTSPLTPLTWPTLKPSSLPSPRDHPRLLGRHPDGDVARLDRELPFCEDMERLPYPNFYYALEDIVRSYVPYLTYSIHRPSIIVGASTRSVYNALLTVAVYAEICKYRNVPFRYPGSISAT